MGARESLPVALAAALLGLGAGYSIAALMNGERPASAAGPAALRPRVQASPAQGERADAPRAELHDVARTTAPAAPVEAAAPRVARAELERAVDAVRAPSVEVARGEGVITGEVTDEQGAPLAGVLVVATPIDSNRSVDPSAIGGGAPEHSSLEEHLRASAERWARTQGLAQRTTSGIDGRFEFDGLAENASYSLTAFLADHVLEPEGSSYGVTPGQRVVFRAEAVRRVPVQLVLAGGGSPSDGVVGVKRGDDEQLYTWTSDAPVLRLAPGRVGLRGYSGAVRAGVFRGETDSDFASASLSLEVADHSGAPIELVLAPRRGIRGRVVDESGTSSGRLLVRLLALGSEADLDLDELAGSQRYARLDGGRFHLLDLEPGLYAVGLSDWGESLLAHQLVTVGEGIVEVDLLVPEPDPEQHLIVRAYGPSGRALRDLDFRWMSRSGSGSRSGGIQGRRAVDGAWWLRPKADFFAAWGKETSFTLTVQHSDLGERTIELVEGQREVEVLYEEPVTLVVVVAGYAGSGYVGKLQLAVAPVTPDAAASASTGRVYRPRGNREVTFSPDGVARLENLAPGRWKIDLLVETGEWQTRPVQSVEVTAMAGEQTVAMDLPVLYDLVVVAPGLAQDAHLFLMSASGEGAKPSFFDANLHAQVGADGRAVFRGLAAGDYVLRGNGTAEVTEITVPCGEVYLDAREPDCLRVAIGDMQGAMYEAGLRAGDLIVAVDGTPFTSMPNVFELLVGEGQVELSVLREGKTVAVTFEKLANGADWWNTLGGMLSPTTRP